MFEGKKFFKKWQINLSQSKTWVETIDCSLVLLRQFDSRNYDTWKIIQGRGGVSPDRYVGARSLQPSLRSKKSPNVKTTRHSVLMSTFNFLWPYFTKQMIKLRNQLRPPANALAKVKFSHVSVCLSFSLFTGESPRTECRPQDIFKRVQYLLRTGCKREASILLKCLLVRCHFQ